MEQLIEILIRVIASFFEAPKARQAPQRTRTAPAPAAAPRRLEPSNRAVVTQKMPTAARAVRRPPPPLQSIAVARPIVTGRNPAPPAAAPPTLTPMARVAPAQPIAPAKASTAQSAASLRKWMTPKTLRQQFILTEIFQPPLALRDRPRD